MKKLFKFSLMAIVSIIATGFQACNTDGGSDDWITEQNILSCYATITDMQANTTTPQQIVTPVTFKLQLNWTNQHGQAWINGFKIGSMTYPTILLEDFCWNIDQNTGWSYTTTEPEIGESATGITPTITDFVMKWIDRLDLSQTLGVYDPGFYFSFTVDGRYRVVGSRQPVILGGTTVSTSPDNENFESKRTIYSMQLNFEKRTANIGIVQANFASGMPEMNMMFKDIPFTIDNFGRSIFLEKDNLIPEINNTPQPSFPILDLRGELTPGTGMKLMFKCNFRNSSMYKVDADLNYTDYGNAIQ